MLDMIKKGFLAGLGLAVVTKEKLEQTVKRLVEEGKISQEEAEKLVQELVKSGDGQWQELEGKIRETIRKSLDAMEICGKKDFDDLAARVDQISWRLAELEKKETSV